MAGSMDFLLNLKANSTGFNQGVNSAKFAVNALVGAMASLGVGLSVNSLIQTADQFTTLQTRVKIAVGETGNFHEAMAGVYQVAISTNTSLDSTASLFARLNDVGKQMGLTQQQVLDVTKTINQAVALGGGTAQASEAAITQLIQALQSGVLRGDEFNSIMEQSPAIIKALAADLGVTTGELRKMAENGELSAERVVTALRNQSGAIQSEYGKFPITVSQALQRIGTAWTKLIGEFNEGTGTTSSIAKALLYIADNLDIVKSFLGDVERGFSTLKDGLGAVDAGTITALKEAVSSAYTAIKELGTGLADGADTLVDTVTTISKSWNILINGVDQSTEKVAFLTRVFQGISIVAGAVADGIYGIRVAADLLVGAFYDGAAAASYWLSKLTFGDVSKNFATQADLLGAKAREYYAKADKLAMDFQSKTIQNLNEAAKSLEQKNAEKLADHKSTLEKISADDAQALAEQAANNEKRKQLEAELGRAKIANNESAMTEIRKQLSLLDESDDKFSKNSIDRQDKKLKAATSYANSAIAANNGILDAATHQNLVSMGYLATQTDAQKKLGEVTVKAFDDGKKAADGFGLTAGKAAENAVKALGIDIDVALNQVRKNFSETGDQVKKVADGFDDLKAKGVDAGTLTYQAWLKWLETAKSQSEVDFAKQKLQEFEKQGVFSAKQVENGIQAIRQVVQKLPADLDPVEQAFERLGIKTKEQLKLVAQSAMADFNTILASGKATAEDLRKAYDRNIQAAIASGDQSVIAAVKAQGAQAGLNVTIDETGKVAIQSYEEIVNGGDKAERSNNRISRSYDRLGDSAVSSAQRQQQAVQQVVNSLDVWSQKLDEITRKQGGMTGSDFMNKPSGSNMTGDLANSLNGAGLMSYSQEQIAAKLEAMGYDKNKAKTKASDIFKDQSWARGGVRIENGQLGLSKFGDLTNYDYVNAQLDKLSKISSATTGGGEPTKTTNVNLQLGGQTVPVTVNSGNEAALLDLLKRAKMVS